MAGGNSGICADLPRSRLKPVRSMKARCSSTVSCGHWVMHGQRIIKRLGAGWTCLPVPRPSAPHAGHDPGRVPRGRHGGPRVPGPARRATSSAGTSK